MKIPDQIKIFEDLIDLEQTSKTEFTGISPKYQWGRVYGGQVVAQGLAAAQNTVSIDLKVHSIHAYFIRGGNSDESITYQVDCLRDGKSFATRRVVATQSDGAILNLSASFQLVEEGPDVDEKLSNWLRRDAMLIQPVSGETRSIEIEWDDGSVETPEDPNIFEFSTSPGWFFDSSSSLHLIGTATLDLLEKRVGKGSGDVRRFRPNIVAQTDEPFEENNWVGKDLLIGSTEIHVKKRTDRCIVITRAFDKYESSRATLRYLAEIMIVKLG